MAFHGRQPHSQNGGAHVGTHGYVATFAEGTTRVHLSCSDHLLTNKEQFAVEANHQHGVMGEEHIRCTDDAEAEREQRLLAEDIADVHKMEEWLKTRSDSLCSMDLDDADMKSDEFGGGFVGAVDANVGNKGGDHVGLDDNNGEMDIMVNTEQLKVLEFREQDKDNTLMTPQELESMPERGLEFEESVGPKELTAINDNKSSPPINSCDLITADDGENELKNCHEIKLDDDSQLNDKVTTISFTTDKLSQTVTKIIINTGQSFKITGNSANILTPDGTLQPITVNNFVLSPQTEISLLNNINADNSNGKYLSLGLYSNNDQLLPVVEALNGNVPTDVTSQDQQLILQDGDGNGTRKGKKWPCLKPGCDRIYDKKCKLKVHLMNHSGERPFKCDIDGCDWSFATAYKLKRHVETHEGKKEYNCPFDDCTKKFTTIYNLNTHKKLHLRPNTVKCPVENCGKMFPIRRKMELHMREHEGTEAPYKCPLEYCGKEYYTANSISTHMRVHQKIDLVCSYEGCGKKFDKSCRLKQHYRQHTGERPYICDVEGCGWRFGNASKLTRHRRKHTGDRKHLCPEEGCGKSFMRAEHLYGHSVVHTKSKPFECTHENCSARFTAKSSLYVHLKKHKEVAEKVVHSCRIDSCDKKYNNKSSLRTHMLNIHTPMLADRQLDYITLFANEELQEITMEGLSQDIVSGSSVAVSVPSITIPVSAGSSNELNDANSLISPSTFVTSTAFHETGTDILGENGSGIVTQLVAEDDRQQLDNVLRGQMTDALPTARLLHENMSGSARTDYCSNHLLLSRTRKNQRQHEVKLSLDSVNSIKADEVNVVSSAMDLNLSQSDVVLTTTAIAFHHPATQFVQSHLLQEDSPVDLYTEDNLLVPIASGTLLSEATSVVEQSVSDGNEFGANSINLKDLE